MKDARQLRDDAQRAQRTGEEFAEVVTRDILYYASASLECVSPAVNGFDPNDVISRRAGTEAAWREAITTLRDDPVRRRAMGAAGRKKVLEHYSVQADVDRLAKLLKSAV